MIITMKIPPTIKPRRGEMIIENKMKQTQSNPEGVK